MSVPDRSASGISRRPTRRRAIGLLAAAAGLPLLARDRRAGEGSKHYYEWQGSALGARARLLLAHPQSALKISLSSFLKALDEQRGRK